MEILPAKSEGRLIVVPAHEPPEAIAARRQQIRLCFDAETMPLLQRLPWHKPRTTWTRKDAHFIPVKSGLSRHIVRFIDVKGNAFAIKETTEPIAEKEMRSYERLRAMGIPTLLPVGTVSRDDGVVAVETPLGRQFVSNAPGYLVTSLLEYSLPNYHLFKRAFNRENRRRIWDAIVRLFVELHCHSVYWGDASLSNMMILFVQHIYEHKWYLSERKRREVPVEEAAQDWYVNVFKPVLRLFSDSGIVEEFPDSTASSLYLNVMLHKYYLSERRGKDAGLVAAFEDYARLAVPAESAQGKISRLTHSIRQLFEKM